MHSIATIQAVQGRIDKAAIRFGKSADAVRLLAVSKGQSVTAIQQAIRYGLRCFGENQVQEALDKIKHIGHEAPDHTPIEWHFIGSIQSNKTRQIAEHFDWVHGIAREKDAQRLNGQRPSHLAALNSLIQINVSAEASKSGVNTDQVLTLARCITDLPHLRFRGLMGIPAPSNDFNEQRRQLRVLSDLFNTLKTKGHSIDTLSMGMSSDLEAAIAEGATMVRIGSALFGPRNQPSIHIHPDE
ncbi:MAG: YggS family pyridoxal phosphate-dependent enzyme [Gammaproteobacteria bacterium]|nr:MAG: YggS family pyridoxal phosphate-dependent enzyme [Gammaproteobacteria bacterium]